MQSEIDDELLGFIALVDDPGLYQWQVCHCRFGGESGYYSRAR